MFQQRLCVYYLCGKNMKSILLPFLTLLSAQFLPAQPFPTLQWSYDIGAPAFGSAAAADLDGDGKMSNT